MAKSVSVRQLAMDCLTQLETHSSLIAPVVDQALQRNDSRSADRGLLTELVYGVIRWRKQLDWVLGQFVASGFRLQPYTRNLLRLGAYQLLHLDRMPPHAAVYETVALSKRKPRTARFINAVLRNVQREAPGLRYPPLESQPAQHIVAALSYPIWLVERWIGQHGVDWTLAFCRAGNEIAPLSIRVNGLKTSRAKLIQSLSAEGALVEESRVAPDGLLLADSPPLRSLQAYRSGWFYVQDESAMLIAHLLNPQPGEKVVDLCAAPGGKTTHIAQLMGNKGELLAVDLSSAKIRQIWENCERLGVVNMETAIANVVQHPPGLGHVDRMLIDVPCSGLGTLRRHPDIRWAKKPQQIKDLARLQIRILLAGAQQIKPGGVLVYSTCSTEPEETLEIIHTFLERRSDFVVENAGDFLPFVPYDAVTSEGFLQTSPHMHDMDGAFAARLRRRF